MLLSLILAGPPITIGNMKDHLAIPRPQGGGMRRALTATAFSRTLRPSTQLWPSWESFSQGKLGKVLPTCMLVPGTAEAPPQRPGPEATERLSRKVGNMGPALPAVGAGTTNSPSDGIRTRGLSFLLAADLCFKPCCLARERTRL